MQIRSRRRICRRGRHSRGGVLCQRHSVKLHTDIDTTHNSCSKGKSRKFIVSKYVSITQGHDFTVREETWTFIFIRQKKVVRQKKALLNPLAGDSG